MADTCKKVSQCTLPNGHDGRHWSAQEGFFKTLSEQSPGFEYREAMTRLACVKCDGKGQFFDHEDEEWVVCHQCRGSGTKEPRDDSSSRIFADNNGDQN